jgi:VCBS repeat-containing protein
VTLSGTGLAPQVNLSAMSLTFGGQLVNTTSPEQTATVTNTGNYPLGISGITTSGDFAQANTCGGPVPVGAACSISVTFAPTAAGTRSGTLVVADDAPDGPHTLVLSGTGTDFSPSASPASTTIVAGGSAIYTLTVTSLDGFHQVVSLNCAGAPQAATCSISPGSVAADGASPATATVIVATTARGFALPRVPLQPPAPNRRFGLLLFLSLLGLAAAARGVPGGGTRPRSSVALTCVFVLLWTACGGGGGIAPAPIGGTPPGTYTLTLTATAGTVARSTTVTLRVN